jgi:3-polyprenyl-4-hydroxybenzoate decarboxylase
METVIGFVAGYLVGTREGREGLARMRSSWRSIRTSPELRRLAAEAVTAAEAAVSRASAGRGGLGLPSSVKDLGGVVSGVTDTLMRRASAAGQHSRAA